MGGVTIETQSTNCNVTNPGGNATSTNITKPTPAALSPEADPAVQGVVALPDGVIPWGNSGSQSASALKLWFFGVGSDTNTGLASVYSWDYVTLTTSTQPLWVPSLLASYSFELDSGMPGVINTPIPATNFFATTITLVTGNSGISEEIISPGHGNDMAHVVISSKGAKFIEVRFGLNGSSTSLNALWKRM